MNLILGQKNTYRLVLALLFFILMGFCSKIIFFPAKDLSQDTFYYISLGMFPGYCGVEEIKDAFTVGIFPVLIFRLLAWLVWHSGNYYEICVLASKFLVALSLSLFAVLPLAGKPSIIQGIGRAFLTCLFFLTYRVITDYVSLNGEIICVGLIVLIYRTINSNLNPILKIALYVVLVILCINTKIQSLPLLISMVLVSNISKRYTIHLICIFLTLFFINEIILFQFKLGYLYKLNDIYRYIFEHAHAHAREYGLSLALMILNFIKRGFITFPLLVIGLLNTGLKFFRGRIQRADKNFILLILVSFFCAVAPLKFFDHYLIFLLIPIYYFIRNCGGLIDIFGFKQGLQHPIGGYSRFTSLLFSILLIVATIYTAVFDYKVIREWVKTRPMERWIEPYPDDQIKYIKQQYFIANDDAKIFVNGWDYSLYSYLGVCPAEHDLAVLDGGMIESRQFYEQVFSRKYEYLIDVIDYSGILKDKKYSIDSNKIYLKDFNNQYELILSNNGLNVYKTK